MSEKKNKFNTTNVIKADAFFNGTCKEIGESDLLLTFPDGIVQFEYIEQEDNELIDVKEGVYSLISDDKIELKKLSPRIEGLLESVDNTSKILDESNQFFNNLNAYDELGIQKKRAVLLYGPPGCHARGTKILMHDGMTKNVEDIVVGDKLMGPDSSCRNVLALARGQEDLYKIIPTKGEPFIVNKSHILHLTPSGKNQTLRCPINLKLSDVMTFSKVFQERMKLTRSKVEYPTKQQVIPPYIFGLWLGYGHSNAATITTMDYEIVEELNDYANAHNINMKKHDYINNRASSYSLSSGLYNSPRDPKINVLYQNLKTLNVLNNKHIPNQYLTGDRQQRLELLAGLLDSDGSLDQRCGVYDFVTKLEVLADHVVSLSRSLGFSAYKKETVKTCQTGVSGKYWRICISGQINTIPSRLPRKQYSLKRQQVKNVLRTGFRYENAGYGDYYGFALDGDHLYLTADYMIHHNTGKTSSISRIINKLIVEDPGTCVIIWNTSQVKAETVYNLFNFKAKYSDKITRMILVAEDIGGTEHSYDGHRGSTAGLLNLLDGVDITFKYPTFIMATTNHPENLLDSLADRPGRFDKLIPMGFPSSKERIDLTAFIAKRVLTPEEMSVLGGTDADDFSIAHLKEIVIRSRLTGRTMMTIVKEIREHKEKLQNSFELKSKKMGIGD